MNYFEAWLSLAVLEEGSPQIGRLTADEWLRDSVSVLLLPQAR